jgi:hypothetical protein
MAIHDLRWNPLTKEWFCIRCGRPSDHRTELGARGELDHYDCVLPSRDVEPGTLHD